MKNFILGAGLTALAMILFAEDEKQKYLWAYEEGKKVALNTSKPSMDLEMACVSLWIAEQKLHVEVR